MADGIEITFEGLPEFTKMMADLAQGPSFQSIARRAVLAGGRVVQAAITEAAPVRPDLPSGTALPPGALKNDIELHVRKESDGSVSAYIGPGSKTRAAARWTEYGHLLVRKGKVVGSVPAHPFIRKSFDESESVAQDAIAMSIAASFARGYQVIMPDDAPALGTGE